MLDEWVKRRDETKCEIMDWRQVKTPAEWPSPPESDSVIWIGELRRDDLAIRCELTV